MSLARLEGELIKAKEDIGKAKHANESFERILQEMSILKSRSVANPKTKEQIINELKGKEIIDLFTSIEEDFEALRAKMGRQSAEKEKIIDFFESIRTKKTFTFPQTESTLEFFEKAFGALEATHISIRPEFIGMIDLTPIAVERGLLKSGSSVIVEKERLSQVLVELISKKMFHDLVFETDNAKFTLKTPHEIVVEAENANLRMLARV